MTLTDEQIEEIKARAEASRVFWKEGKQMVDAPERIRVAQDADGFWTCREAVSGSQEYVRADLYADLEAELVALEAAARVRAEDNAGEPVAWGEDIDGKIVSVRLDKSRHCTVPLYRTPQPSGAVKALSFDALRHANNERQKEWPGNEHTDVAFRAIEVAGEAGEVLEAVKKFLRAERGIRGSTATTKDIASEMADTIIALDLLANQIGVDLGAAVAKKFNATSEKYDLATRLSALTA